MKPLFELEYETREENNSFLEKLSDNNHEDESTIDFYYIGLIIVCILKEDFCCCNRPLFLLVILLQPLYFCSYFPDMIYCIDYFFHFKHIVKISEAYTNSAVCTADSLMSGVGAVPSASDNYFVIIIQYIRNLTAC